MIQPSNKPKDALNTQPAIERAHRNALRLAALHHLKVPTWRNNQVVWVDPEELDPKARSTDQSPNS